MTAGIVLALLLALAVMAFLIAPLLRRGASDPEAVGGSLSEERELESRNQMLLAGLRDLEDDRATAKIGDDDYARLKASLSLEAVEVMRRLDTVSEDRRQTEEAAREAARPLRYPGRERPGRPH